LWGSVRGGAAGKRADQISALILATMLAIAREDILDRFVADNS